MLYCFASKNLCLFFSDKLSMVITLAYPPALDHNDSPVRLELDADLVPPSRSPLFTSRDHLYHLTITNYARKSSEPYDVSDPHALYHLQVVYNQTQVVVTYRWPNTYQMTAMQSTS